MAASAFACRNLPLAHAIERLQKQLPELRRGSWDFRIERMVSAFRREMPLQRADVIGVLSVVEDVVEAPEEYGVAGVEEVMDLAIEVSTGLRAAYESMSRDEPERMPCDRRKVRSIRVFLWPLNAEGRDRDGVYHGVAHGRNYYRVENDANGKVTYVFASSRRAAIRLLDIPQAALLRPSE